MKKGSTFLQLLTVRLGGVTPPLPPPTVSLTIEYPFFWTPFLNWGLSWNGLPSKDKLWLSVGGLSGQITWYIVDMEMGWDDLSWSDRVPDRLRWSQIVADWPRWSQMVGGGGTWWTEMVPDLVWMVWDIWYGPRRADMVLDGQKRSNIVCVDDRWS